MPRSVQAARSMWPTLRPVLQASFRLAGSFLTSARGIGERCWVMITASQPSSRAANLAGSFSVSR
jgi:hypothetical protein